MCWWGRTVRNRAAGPAPQGGIPGPCLPKWLLVHPKRKLCPPKRRLCPKEINRLGATGEQIEASDSQNSAYCFEFESKNCCLVIFVRTRTDFHETLRIFWDEDLFFFFVPQNSWTIGRFLRWNQNLWTFLDWRPFLDFTFFRLIHTLKFT